MLHTVHTIDDITAFERIPDLYRDQGITASDLLFFDIETTGLSPKDSYLYMVGCMYLQDDHAILAQFFSQDITEEAELIGAFLQLLFSHPVLVHYNGSTFDVPFLRSKAEQHGITFPPQICELDIYQCIKPYKKLLRLSSLRQKAVEAFLKLERRDIYDGGELIDIYLKYIARSRIINLVPHTTGTGSDDILGETGEIPPSGVIAPLPGRKITDTFSPVSGLRLLGNETLDDLMSAMLLHNYEDVKNMGGISLLMAIPAFFKGDFHISRHTLSDDLKAMTIELIPYRKEIIDLFTGRCSGCLSISSGFKLSMPGPHPFSVTFSAAEGSLMLSFEPVCCELKLFLPDYRDYYYLPSEDYCVHRSLGSLLDRSKAVKCTASNCYIKKTGAFAPVPVKKGGTLKDLIRLYRAGYKDNAYYALIPDLMEDSEALKTYALQLLNALL
ncbi:MAG: ribonuclease H-like domain-containing protein [Lachnospiraceae bacterium]|nr:ribonuclease H-like domain-containing protein [Lachnospiraceae bacterium]